MSITTKGKALERLTRFLEVPPEDQEGLTSILQTHPLIAGGDAVENLTPTQEIFLIGKLYGSTDRAAAIAAGVDPTTPLSWKKKAEFKELYEEVVSNPVLMAANSVGFATAKAINRLIMLLDHNSVEVVQWAIGQLLMLSRVAVERKEVNVIHELDLDRALRELELAKQRGEITGASEV